jgi:predicted XRE-type DNA-binding protein
MTSLSYVSDEYLLSQAGIDTEKYKLGNKPCRKAGHSWSSTGRALQYKSGSHCVECAKNRKVILTPTIEEIEFVSSKGMDATVVALGSLCVHKHDWENTGKSLRYIKHGHCTGCQRTTEGSVKSKTMTLEARFWSYVNIPENKETDCWDWTGPILKSGGYGTFQGKIDGKCVKIRAHRFSYELHHGPIPEDFVVRHYVCDRPVCVSPFHLRVGTQKDNSADAMRKLRHVYGEKTSLAKLKTEEVKEIIELYATGNYSQYKLADMFGVHQVHISRIVNGKRRRIA